MAKTATAPLAHSLAQSVAHNAREQGRDSRSQGGFRTVSIEERTAALEARWEETVPTLATSRDISDLRGEMRNLENRLIKWGVGAGIALLAVFAAVFIANTARMDALDAKLDAGVSKLDAKLDASVSKLDAKLETSVGKLDARIDRLDAKIDRLDEKIDSRFDAIMAELRELRSK